MDLETYWIRRALIAAALMTALFLGGAALTRAEDDCQKRVNKADHNLHEAIEHHGWQSSQADHWRHELAEARNYCWDHGRRWWDADANRWRTDRDWDDHDHDRH
ncbi:MAG TPA: hypothetical protein VMT75_04885 [Candidatus Saccharimonadales bacterium]|nr:hypothetical protein [Candidatus Saccharimonadales bacterium]